MSVDMINLVLAACAIIAVPSSVYAVRTARRSNQQQDIETIDERAEITLTAAIAEGRIIGRKTHEDFQRLIGRELRQFREDVTDRFDRIERRLDGDRRSGTDRRNE